MKRFLRILLPAFGILLPFACQMENKALDEPLTPEEASPLARMTYARWPSESNFEQLDLVGVTATACCGQGHAASGDSDAASAIDNNPNSWLHPNWSNNTQGHKNDTAGWTEGGTTYATVKSYIDEITTDPAASGVQNGMGGHWLTLDLGSPVNNLAALAYLGRTQADRKIRGYEIWVSNSDIKWDVSNAALVAKGSWGTGNDYQYARFVPQTVRYIQLRQLRGTGDGSTGDYGCIANLRVETSTSAFPGLDKSMLLSAVIQSTALLKTLDPATPQYRVMSLALASAKQTLNDPSLEAFPLAGQSSIDAAADALLAVLNALDPPRKPPED